MRILGVNAIFHDPAAALVIDGRVVAATEEERLSRRKSRKRPVPFSNWEIPERSAAWCLAQARLRPEDLDLVSYSYDPVLVPATQEDVAADHWEGLRTRYAEMAPTFLQRAIPGLEPSIVRFVPHHLAHAASACLAAPFPSSAVLVLDGRGERASHLAGRSVEGQLEVLASQQLPHSLGLFYERVTEHLGFRRSADEYKVMGLAAYGEPRFLPALRELVRTTGDGGFLVDRIDWSRFVPRRAPGGQLTSGHADLAASAQRQLEEIVLELARWLHDRTGQQALTMAGGVALNCVANSRVATEGPFQTVWIQPAAGDAGTALGGALHLAQLCGDRVEAMSTAALGRRWTHDELAIWLREADLAHERPGDVAEAVAEALAENKIVAWFQGPSEYGPRALGHRSLLADPTHASNTQRLNAIKSREQFRPLAPMVLNDRAGAIFEGPLPSPYMLFTQRVRPEWAPRIPAVVHVDGTARVQTVDPRQEPLVARLLTAFERRTGVPVLINTSLNTTDRPMVDDPRDALECFGSAPIDILALGPYLLRRNSARR